ncbi:hypothetical protein T10_2833 [Trichinella papuae]|uniref:Uncharacterized protein n=1 Tax=Trichinella papuae TaxID=268474 RepID=A0A0V1MHK7_9BILA|nr:hypothetical protein T10_2833 [Trichinella papuae]
MSWTVQTYPEKEKEEKQPLSIQHFKLIELEFCFQLSRIRCHAVQSLSRNYKAYSCLDRLVGCPLIFDEGRMEIQATEDLKYFKDDLKYLIRNPDLVVLLRSVFIGKPVKTDNVLAASVWRIHLKWLILSDFFTVTELYWNMLKIMPCIGNEKN